MKPPYPRLAEELPLFEKRPELLELPRCVGAGVAELRRWAA